MKYNYSFSQNRIYEECPMKYKLCYIDKIKEPTNENLELGNIIHKLCELKFWEYSLSAPWPKEIEENYNKLCKMKNTLYAHSVYEGMKNFWWNKEIIATEFSVILNNIIFKIDVAYYDENHKDIIVADYKVTKKPKTIKNIYDEGQFLAYTYAVNHGFTQFLTGEVFDIAKVQYINILNYDLQELTVRPIKPEIIDGYVADSFVDRMLMNMDKIDSQEFPKNCRSCHNWGRDCWYKEQGFCK